MMLDVYVWLYKTKTASGATTIESAPSVFSSNKTEQIVIIEFNVSFHISQHRWLQERIVSTNRLENLTDQDKPPELTKVVTFLRSLKL